MPVQSVSSSTAHMFTEPFVKHLAPALLAGLALRLYFIWHFPFSSGDTAYYEELARNWLYHGVYGFYSHGQLLPSDARDRKSVVEGKRVDLGGRRIIKKKKESYRVAA